MAEQAARPLRRILGLGFGVAMVFGTMVGVGILRLPSMVAAALGDRTLVVACWAVGGLYALMGATAVSELAAMVPQAGGFRIYARRAFGEGCGFAIGWCDWLSNAGVLAYVSMTAAAFMGALWPPAVMHERLVGLLLVSLFTALHLAGIRLASSLTRVISVAVGLVLTVLVIACFIAAPVASGPAVAGAAVRTGSLIAGAVTALRAVLLAYGGWYAPIYMAEENRDPTTTLPRAIIGGAFLVSVFYLVINVAFVHVLPIDVLSRSSLPAADAARAVLPRGGAELVTVLSLLTVLSLMNNVLLMGPRVLFAIGRDGLFTQQAARVSATGTPTVALLLTSVAASAFVLSGTFEQTIALCAVLFLIEYVVTFAAVFVLRHREPKTARPYEAIAHPLSTAIVLAGSVVLLIAAARADPRSGILAALFMAACIPCYAWIQRRRRPDAAAA